MPAQFALLLNAFSVWSSIELFCFSGIYSKPSRFVGICTLCKPIVDFSCWKVVSDRNLFCLQAGLSTTDLEKKK